MPLYTPATVDTGTTILDGVDFPLGGLGQDGNYYIDTDSHIMYGPKDSAGLSAPINLLADTAPAATNASAFRAGNKYHAVAACQIVGARFWRELPQSTLTRQVALYNNANTLVTLSAASTESVSTVGWVEVTFATPVDINAGENFSLVYDDSRTPYTSGAPTLSTPDVTFVAGLYGTFGSGFPGSSGAFSFQVDASVRLAGDIWPVALTGA